MKAAERDNLVRETHQALLGIAGTEEKGVAGDVKEMKKDIKAINSRLINVEVKQEERNKVSKKSIAGWGTGAVGLVAALWKSFMS